MYYYGNCNIEAPEEQHHHILNEMNIYGDKDVRHELVVAKGFVALDVGPYPAPKR